VYFRYPKILAYNNEFDLNEGIGAAGRLLKAQTALIPEQNFTTMIVSIPRLQTYEVVALAVPFSISDATEFSGKVNVETKDHFQVEIPYTITYSYLITMFIACEGAEPVIRPHSIEVFDVSESLSGKLWMRGASRTENAIKLISGD
jgi:hypothetical protein